MLKKLNRRLQTIFTITIMCLITAVMAVLSYGQYQSEVAADKNYLQKMASFFVLELETEQAPAERILVNWGNNEVSTILKDLYGNVLYENNAGFPTEAETLSSSMNEMIAYFHYGAFGDHRQPGRALLWGHCNHPGKIRADLYAGDLLSENLSMGSF